MQNFAKVLNVDKENIVVMATEADAIQIMKTKDVQSRRDPTLKNYQEALKMFVEKAKLNPSKNYLQIQSFAGNGYSIMGFQCVATSYYDPLTKFYQMIPVEGLVRSYFSGV